MTLHRTRRIAARVALFVFFGAVSASLAAHASVAPPSTAMPTALVDTYGKLPILFESNGGQADPAARFIARGNGYAVPTNLRLTDLDQGIELVPKLLRSDDEVVGCRTGRQVLTVDGGIGVERNRLRLIEREVAPRTAGEGNVLVADGVRASLIGDQRIGERESDSK